MPSFETHTLGIEGAIQALRDNMLPAAALGYTRKGLNGALAIIARGIRAAVPPTKTKGHSPESIKKAIGKSVKQQGVGGFLIAKVGVGVGKKRGTYRPTGVFLAVGTVDRYSGSKTQRKNVKRRWTVYGNVSTGKPVRFRGRVDKYPFVQMGVEATKVQAKAKFEEVVHEALTKSFRASLSTIQ